MTTEMLHFPIQILPFCRPYRLHIHFQSSNSSNVYVFVMVYFPGLCLSEFWVFIFLSTHVTAGCTHTSSFVLGVWRVNCGRVCCTSCQDARTRSAKCWACDVTPARVFIPSWIFESPFLNCHFAHTFSFFNFLCWDIPP